MQMTMPNFLIIGAAKAGTTSLYRYLRQHPQVCMSEVKEARFFAFHHEEERFRGPRSDWLSKGSVTSLEAYRALFKPRPGQVAIGEASPLYLYSARACALMRQLVPSVKIIAVLRQPADRAFSHFLDNRRSLVEPISSFEKALDAESQRMSERWGAPWYYRDRGYYHRQLGIYFDAFPRDQIGVWLQDDLRADTSRVSREIQAFLGIELVETDAIRRHNVSQTPRGLGLGRLLSRGSAARRLGKRLVPGRFRSPLRGLADRTAYTRPVLQRSLRRELTEGYRTDIEALQSLINRDLSHWLE